MKDIKDYLHLYLGCEAIMSTDHWFTPEGDKMVKIDGLTSALDSRVFVFYNYDTTQGNAEIEYFKPILRPLSDMTEEEKTEFQTICRIEKEDLDCVTLRPDFFSDEPTLGTAHLTDVMQWADGVKYLLSKYFDLFNLIPEGLAIDATSVKQIN